MIIEVCGIDGSGKTTQIDRLARLAQDCSIPCYERSLRSTSRRIVGGIAAGRGHSSWAGVFDRDAVELATALEMYQLFYSTVQPIRFPGQIVVMDHYARGWLAAAIAENAANVDQLAAVYGALPAPDLSVQLDCPTDTAYARILARPKGDHILRVGGRARLDRLGDAYGSPLDEAAGYPAVHLPGDGSADEVAAAFAGLIRAWAADHDPVLDARLSTRPEPAVSDPEES